MSATIWDKAAQEAVSQLPSEELLVILDIRQRMRKGFWPSLYLTVFGQNHFDGYSPEDAYCFAQLHTKVATGEIAIVQIEIGCTPRRDSDIEYNNKALSNLPHPFYGGYGPDGQAGDDGVIGWNSSVKMSVYDMHTNAKTEIAIRPWSVALEVGTTAFHRTFGHVWTSGCGVARWPYGSEVLTILYNQRPFDPSSCI